MAWIKAIEQELTGVVVEYWEVISINYLHKQQTSNLTVGEWVNQAAYDANKAHVVEKNWIIPSGLAPELAAGAVGFITAYARAQPEFEGSEDVT